MFRFLLMVGQVGQNLSNDHSYHSIELGSEMTMEYHGILIHSMVVMRGYSMLFTSLSVCLCPTRCISELSPRSIMRRIAYNSLHLGPNLVTPIGQPPSLFHRHSVSAIEHNEKSSIRAPTLPDIQKHNLVSNSYRYKKVTSLATDN